MSTKTATETKKVTTFGNVLNRGLFFMYDGCIYSKGPQGEPYMRLENKMMEGIYSQLKNVNVIHRPEAILIWQQFVKKNANFGYEIESTFVPEGEFLNRIENAKTSGESAE